MRRRSQILAVVAVALAGGVATVSARQLVGGSAGTGNRGTPTPTQEAAMARVVKAAVSQGAIAVSARQGVVFVLVHKGQQLRLPKGPRSVRIVETEHSAAEFKMIESKVAASLARGGYSVGSSVDASTARVVLVTGAPREMVEPFEREFKDLVRFEAGRLVPQ